MRAGRRVAPDPSIARMRERFRSDLERLPAKAKRLAHAEHVHVRHSDALTALTRETTEDALLRAGLRERRGSD